MMTLLSRKADYALLILSYLHQHNTGACAREVADHYQLSRSFVANILKELCQKGFVTSQRGVKGGYLLQRPANQITLGELLNSIDDNFRLASCNEPHPEDDGCTLATVCPMKGPMAQVHQRIAEVLAHVMLAELFPPTENASTSVSMHVLNVLPAGSPCASAGHGAPPEHHSTEILHILPLPSVETTHAVECGQ